MFQIMLKEIKEHATKAYDKISEETPYEKEPKALTIINGEPSHEQMLLIEGLDLCVTDPNNEEAMLLWGDIFNDPKPVESEDEDADKVYPWSALDQVISMGNIATVVKQRILEKEGLKDVTTYGNKTEHTIDEDKN